MWKTGWFLRSKKGIRKRENEGNFRRGKKGREKGDFPYFRSGKGKRAYIRVFPSLCGRVGKKASEPCLFPDNRAAWAEEIQRVSCGGN